MNSPQDVLVKISTDVEGVVDFKDTALPSVEWKGVEYANTKWSREWDTIIDVPEVSELRGLWERWARKLMGSTLHESVGPTQCVALGRDLCDPRRRQPGPGLAGVRRRRGPSRAQGYVPPSTSAGISTEPSSLSELTRYLPKKKVREVKKLLGGGTKETAAPEPTPAVEDDAPKEVMPIISYYHPNVSLEIVASAGPIAWSSLPLPLQHCPSELAWVLDSC